MKSYKSIVLYSALALIIAQPSMVFAKEYSPTFNSVDLVKDIKILGSDAYEGRGVGTPAEKKTIDYIAKNLAEAGFSPGGDNGTWFQDVQLRRFTLSDSKASLNLGNTGTNLEVGKDITISTRNATKDVNLDKVPLVFAGYGITAPERGWSDFKDENGNKIDVKGKVIVVLVNDPDFYQPELNTFGGKAMTYYGRWTYKYEEAARQGALGCIIIHESDAAAYGWETVKNSNTGKKIDIMRDPTSPAGPDMESWITYDTAQKMFKGAGLDLEALKVAARSKNFHAQELKNVTLSASFKTNVETITSHNVIGILKGKKHPDEYIAYSAHWDHLGIGLPDKKGDKIYNGALDNASGVASILEIARAYKKAPRPDRSIIMFSWTAEESGLLGSEYYASHPIYPLAKTVAGFNIDGINIAGKTKNIEVTGYGQSSLEDDLAVYAKKQGRYISPEDTPEAGHFFRSDHFPFVKRGVPMLAAGSGVDMRNGGVAAGKAANEEYLKAHYHQPSDEYSPTWKLDGAIEDLQIYFKMGYDLANSTKWPEWKPSSEFKAERDKSAADRK